MSIPKVHRIKGREVIPRYRVIPYAELVTILKEDGEAFFEDTRKEPLNRQTLWKAAQRLSELVGKKVKVERALLRLENGGELEGYSFSLEQ